VLNKGDHHADELEPKSNQIAVTSRKKIIVKTKVNCNYVTYSLRAN